MNVRIEPLRFIVELALVLDTQYGIQKLKDKDGHLIVPIDKFPDFCSDMGAIVGKILNTIGEPEKGTEE